MKKYEEPKLELIKLESDIVTLSDPTEGDQGTPIG